MLGGPESPTQIQDDCNFPNNISKKNTFIQTTIHSSDVSSSYISIPPEPGLEDYWLHKK